TQVAAMVLGFADSAGYQLLVEQYCGVRLDKSSRFTDWSQRPLSNKQLSYALGDVTYLRQIYERMRDQLDENQRSSWLSEEMTVLTSDKTYEIDPDSAWRRLKHRSRDAVFLGQLKAIAAWRENTAQTINIPRARLVSDDALLQIAAQKPKTQADLEKIRGVSSGFAKSKNGAGVITALQAAKALPKEDIPQRKDRSVLRSNPLGDLLKLLLKARAQEVGVAPKLIASADDLDRLANTDGDRLNLMQGWRYEVFGKEALALKSGQIALTAKGKDIEILELDD
ncbi:MAG: HRDC domain-containing protein, partial [Pseudomonadota bacterium]